MQKKSQGGVNIKVRGEDQLIGGARGGGRLSFRTKM
jgi:hypothetical protein